MSMIRVGLIGFGLAGRVFHAPLVSSVDGLELSAVVERKSDNAAALYPGIHTYRSVEELLADPSIKLVVVATPNATHYAMAMRALEAAKHVVVDKPAGMSTGEIAELMELAGGLGLKLIPFHNRRWDSDFQTIQKLLHEKTLGNLVHFESTFDRWRPGLSTRAWKEEPDQGGLLFDLGTHLVDQALHLFGYPDFVGAEVKKEREGESAKDAFTVRLHYYTGLTVNLGANLLSTSPRPRFHLRGSRGNFVKWGLDGQEAALGAISRIENPNWGLEPEDSWGTLSVDRDGAIQTSKPQPIPGDYRKFYEGVRDAILGNGAVPVQPLDAWRTTRVLEYAIESGREGRNIACDWSVVPD
ncbi:MAG: Gfo/Idh/MocA family oxidoreductase [Acidobacteriota bacterium]|nr:Gfo/Idh/MocA family oxidoreductase [Acidobacteriota bacterium]